MSFIKQNLHLFDIILDTYVKVNEFHINDYYQKGISTLTTGKSVHTRTTAVAEKCHS